MTPSELKHGTSETHFFDRKTMQFFGDSVSRERYETDAERDSRVAKERAYMAEYTRRKAIRDAGKTNTTKED